MKIPWMFARFVIGGALAGGAVLCQAEPIITTAKMGDLELTLILESDNAYIGRPYPVEVVVKNTRESDIVLVKFSEFLLNIDVKVFNLFDASLVPMSIQGKGAINRALVRSKEVKLRPGEETSFFHPMLGWSFDLSVPSRYRIEVTWNGAVAGEPQRSIESLPTLTAEFALNPDPNMRSKPLGLQGAKALSVPGAKADKAK